ncbi:protein of unknown function [Tenacibaculum maritimum NCIMB 2154]|uniref:Uncharacterized protein n=1 Tax=Tenacibaculum maritimum NCIMB 2154 TaxID=1349785 RepID=A0A2H1EB53_9FLAO|nr:protein of unknown function [Tenacibaculum maritimum NCIMB 2154]
MILSFFLYKFFEVSKKVCTRNWGKSLYKFFEVGKKVCTRNWGKSLYKFFEVSKKVCTRNWGKILYKFFEVGKKVCTRNWGKSLYKCKLTLLAFIGIYRLLLELISIFKKGFPVPFKNFYFCISVKGSCLNFRLCIQLITIKRLFIFLDD